LSLNIFQGLDVFLSYSAFNERYARFTVSFAERCETSSGYMCLWYITISENCGFLYGL